MLKSPSREQSIVQKVVPHLARQVRCIRGLVVTEQASRCHWAGLGGKGGQLWLQSVGEGQLAIITSPYALDSTSTTRQKSGGGATCQGSLQQDKLCA